MLNDSPKTPKLKRIFCIRSCLDKQSFLSHVIIISFTGNNKKSGSFKLEAADKALSYIEAVDSNLVLIFHLHHPSYFFKILPVLQIATTETRYTLLSEQSLSLTNVSVPPVNNAELIINKKERVTLSSSGTCIKCHSMKVSLDGNATS